MTHVALEEYIIKYLPDIQKQFVITDDDDDSCQAALISMFNTANKLVINDIHDFKRIFFSYYNQHRIHDKIDEYVRLLPFVSESIEDTACHHDPWKNNQTEAIEYVELIKEPWLKSIIFDYYIMGLDMPEIGTKHSITKQYVLYLLRKGIKEIKLAMSSSPDPLKG